MITQYNFLHEGKILIRVLSSFSNWQGKAQQELKAEVWHIHIIKQAEYFYGEGSLRLKCKEVEEVAHYPSLIQITWPELKHEETMAS